MQSYLTENTQHLYYKYQPRHPGRVIVTLCAEKYVRHIKTPCVKKKGLILKRCCFEKVNVLQYPFLPGGIGITWGGGGKVSGKFPSNIFSI
jgi:hypothetical protein